MAGPDPKATVGEMARNLMRIGWQEAHDLFCDFAGSGECDKHHPSNPHETKEERDD